MRGCYFSFNNAAGLWRSRHALNRACRVALDFLQVESSCEGESRLFRRFILCALNHSTSSQVIVLLGRNQQFEHVHRCILIDMYVNMTFAQHYFSILTELTWPRRTIHRPDCKCSGALGSKWWRRSCWVLNIGVQSRAPSLQSWRCVSAGRRGRNQYYSI